MSRRYSYTPKRSGRITRPDGPANSRGPWLAAVIVFAAVVLVAWVSFRDGGGGDAACSGPDCNGGALVSDDRAGAVATRRPTATPSRTVDPQPAPQITGLAAAVIEEPCGALLYGLNERSHLPPASLAKIATALVAADQGDLTRLVDVDVDGGALSLDTGATVMGLVPGQRVSVLDLLYGLLLRSGNDAAIQIAEAVAGDEDSFVALMNAKAAELGLTDTHFTNPHGLDDPNLYTSAHDIAMLGRELLREPRLAEIVRTQRYTPDWEGGELENLNLLLSGYSGSIGVKTGYTDQAGQTIVAAADDGGRRLIVSVLHSADLYGDAGRLLDWGFENAAPACGTPAQAQELTR